MVRTQHRSRAARPKDGKWVERVVKKCPSGLCLAVDGEGAVEPANLVWTVIGDQPREVI